MAEIPKALRDLTAEFTEKVGTVVETHGQRDDFITSRMEAARDENARLADENFELFEERDRKEAAGVSDPALQARIDENLRQLRLTADSYLAAKEMRGENQQKALRKLQELLAEYSKRGLPVNALIAIVFELLSGSPLSALTIFIHPSTLPTPVYTPTPTPPPPPKSDAGSHSQYASAWLGEAVSDVPLASVTHVSSDEASVAASPTEGSDAVLNAVSEGGALAGPFGMLAGAVTALLMRSKGFTTLLEAVKGVVQSVADMLGSALSAIVPLVRALGRSLRPMLEALTPLLLMAMRLNPQFLLMTAGVRILAPAMQRLALGVNFAAVAITQTIVGFLRIVRRFFKKLGLKTKGIDKLIKAVKEATAPLDELADMASSVTEGLINAPDGFRLAATRFMATTALGGGGTRAGAGRLAGLGRPLRRVLGVEIVSKNPERTWQQFKRLLERQNYRSSGTPLGIVTPFATGPAT